MDRLSVTCILLAISCVALLIREFRLRRRIRRMVEDVDGFNAGYAEALDVALQEDSLAHLQNGIADTQQSLVRARELHSEECRRTEQLTADISHQLKTPLTTLRLYTELDGAAHMEESLVQLQRMEDLVHSLLRLERLCADGYAFTFEQTDVKALIYEQWQGLQTIFPDKSLIFSGSACIRCDRKWLAEAFLNLLKNACEHTPDGGKIWIYIERTESLFFCTIEDNGGGVDEAELPRLFHRFYRSEHQRKNGIGIGLAIVKEIILRHHGTIIAENGVHGLKMTLSLPMLDRTLTNP